MNWISPIPNEDNLALTLTSKVRKAPVTRTRSRYIGVGLL